MDQGFYNQQYQPPQQQQQQHGAGHFQNNNASHNYFMQHQQHFIHSNANVLQHQHQQSQGSALGHSNAEIHEQHQQGGNFNNDGNYQNPQSPYRNLYQATTPTSSSHSQDNTHPSGLLVPKVEVVEEQTPSPPQHYGTPPHSTPTPGESRQTPTTVKENNTSDSYQCSICYESFPTAKTYKGHMASHKIPMTTYSNEVNNSTPADVHLLREHILAHVTQQQQQQQQFQLVAGNNSVGMGGDGVTPPGGLAEGNLIEKCQYCYKLFADRMQLQIHLKEHNSLKEYKCLNCNKLYASLNYLKLHYKMHADLKPYKCQYCDKRFTFSSNLYVHHRIHTGHKPYRCEKCSKCFSQINSLKQHHRIHRDQVPSLQATAGPGVGPPAPPSPAALATGTPGGLLGNASSLVCLGGSTLSASSLLPPMVAGNSQQHLPNHHLPQPGPQHQQQNPKTKPMKSEFPDGTEEVNHTEDKVLNMSSRPPNPGDLMIQDVIMQQLQQRLVSQP